MIIDDSAIDAFINQKMIQNHGFADKIYTHNSSESALEFFRNFDKLPELPYSILPNIIMLDLNMPNQDGFAFLEEFEKISSKIKDKIKVVFVSSSNSNEDIEKAKSYPRVLAYVVKPIMLRDLDMIKELLKNGQSY